MKVDRIQRVNERILRELGTGIYRIGQGSENLGLISFVAVNTSPDLHNAYVTVSVMGSEEQAKQCLSWLRKNRIEFQSYIARTVGLKYTPVLSFKLTNAIEKGNRVLNILDSLNLPEEETPPEQQ